MRLPKKFIVVGLIIFIALTMTVLSVLEENGGEEQAPAKPGEIRSVDTNSPLNTVTIGKTTRKEVEKIDGLVAKDDSTYLAHSEGAIRTDGVMLQNDTVRFKRTRSPAIDRVADYKKAYGEPEREIQGSLYFGENAKTYIFAKKGIAIIANMNTEEVYELQQFQPVSVERYLNLYGEDIQEVDTDEVHREP